MKCQRPSIQCAACLIEVVQSFSSCPWCFVWCRHGKISGRKGSKMLLKSFCFQILLCGQLPQQPEQPLILVVPPEDGSVEAQAEVGTGGKTSGHICRKCCAVELACRAPVCEAARIQHLPASMRLFGCYVLQNYLCLHLQGIDFLGTVSKALKQIKYLEADVSHPLPSACGRMWHWQKS